MDYYFYKIMNITILKEIIIQNNKQLNYLL